MIACCGSLSKPTKISDGERPPPLGKAIMAQVLAKLATIWQLDEGHSFNVSSTALFSEEYPPPPHSLSGAEVIPNGLIERRSAQFGDFSLQLAFACSLCSYFVIRLQVSLVLSADFIRYPRVCLCHDASSQCRAQHDCYACMLQEFIAHWFFPFFKRFGWGC